MDESGLADHLDRNAETISQDHQCIVETLTRDAHGCRLVLELMPRHRGLPDRKQVISQRPLEMECVDQLDRNLGRMWQERART